MPSIAEATISPLTGRKRRREDPTSMEVQMKLSSSPHITRHAPITHLTTEFRNEIQHAERRLLVPKTKRCHDSKRQRVERPSICPEEERDLYLPLNAVENGVLCVEDRQQRAAVESEGKRRMNLGPCHICYRKPTVRAELDAFADCEGCARRTCYVCIRECLGSTAVRDVRMKVGDLDDGLGKIAFSFREGMPMGVDGGIRRERNVSGYATTEIVFDLDAGDNLGGRTEWDMQMTEHKGMVCSRCCVERGTEGEVWCMGCLRAEKNA